jgi:hypothetical protein
MSNFRGLLGGAAAPGQMGLRVRKKLTWEIALHSPKMVFEALRVEVVILET